MEREILYEDSKITIEYVKEGNYIHQTWKGITSKEVFEKLLYKTLQLAKDIGTTGLLLDARKHKGIGPESQALAAKETGEFAKTLTTGKFREAIIVPVDIFSKFSVENFSRKMAENKYPVMSMFFDNIEKAEDWLRSNE